MAEITFDTYPYYKKLINAGMTEEQAEVQIEIMVDISTETKLTKPIEFQNTYQPHKSLWKEAAKTFFWTWLIGMIIALVVALEIVGLKHISFT
ncbi:MAG TPA: hypothetical protein VGV92_05500 [Gammaproteobacteria bacterium]|nr:hypothetical protein [Gammaproteobacteria bacterium]